MKKNNIHSYSPFERTIEFFFAGIGKTQQKNNEAELDVFFPMVFLWNQRQKKVSYVFSMTNSYEPNDAIVTPSIGMEILHFSFVFTTIQRGQSTGPVIFPAFVCCLYPGSASRRWETNKHAMHVCSYPVFQFQIAMQPKHISILEIRV